MPSYAHLPEQERRLLAQYMASLKVEDWYLEATKKAEYEKLTGSSILLNTSLNLNGEPIVNTPDDALRCFVTSGMDALFIGNHLLLKQNFING